jgi:hypothetical protein
MVDHQKYSILWEDIIDSWLLALATIADTQLWWPYITFWLSLAQSFYWNALKLRQERALEFFEFIKNNTWNFSKEIVQTEEFQDCFVLTLESYIRQRNQKKRIIIQNIFLWYNQRDKKLTEEFEMEKLYNINALISIEAIEWLKFIKYVLIPIKEEYITKKSIESEIPNWWKNKERRKDLFDEREPITKFWNEYIYDIYNPNSEKVKEKYWWKINSKEINNLFDREQYEQRKNQNIVNELNSLWIFYSRYRHIGTIWGWIDEEGSNFTLIGKQYLDFINLEIISKNQF